MNWLTDLLLLATLFALFYFSWLGSYPLFTPDEGRYAEVAREMLVSGDYVTPRVNGVAFLDKPAFYYWLQAGSMHWFGINEWAIRFFPAVFGMIGCLLVYLAGRTLFNRRTGILAAVILATSPIYFCCAHYANLDLEVAVLISTALLLFLMAALGTRFRLALFLGAYLFTGLAFFNQRLNCDCFSRHDCRPLDFHAETLALVIRHAPDPRYPDHHCHRRPLVCSGTARKS